MKNLRKNMPCPYQLALCTFMLIPSTLIYSGTASASASRHNDKTNPTLMEAVDSSKIKPSIVLDEVVVTGQGNRSEEHTSELQSRQYLVCRLLLEKKNTKNEQRLYN